MKDDFAEFSKDYVLYCHITTRVPTDPHQNLLHEKGGHAFPYIVFLDAEGEVLAEPEGRSVGEYRKTGAACARLMKTKAAAEKGEAGAKVEVTLLRLELGHPNPEEALRELSKADLSGAQAARLERIRSEHEIRSILESAVDEASRAAAAEKCYRLVKAGKPGPSRDQEKYAFYVLVLHGAEKEKDAAVFEKAYRALHRAFKTYPGAGGFFEAVEKKLKELKNAVGEEDK